MIIPKKRSFFYGFKELFGNSPYMFISRKVAKEQRYPTLEKHQRIFEQYRKFLLNLCKAAYGHPIKDMDAEERLAAN